SLLWCFAVIQALLEATPTLRASDAAGVRVVLSLVVPPTSVHGPVTRDAHRLVVVRVCVVARTVGPFIAAVLVGPASHAVVRDASDLPYVLVGVGVFRRARLHVTTGLIGAPYMLTGSGSYSPRRARWPPPALTTASALSYADRQVGNSSMFGWLKP